MDPQQQNHSSSYLRPPTSRASRHLAAVAAVTETTNLPTTAATHHDSWDNHPVVPPNTQILGLPNDSQNQTTTTTTTTVKPKPILWVPFHPWEDDGWKVLQQEQEQQQQQRNDFDKKLPTCHGLDPSSFSTTTRTIRHNHSDHDNLAVAVLSKPHQPYYPYCPRQFRNVAVMRHPLDRVVSHLQAQQWTEQQVRHQLVVVRMDPQRHILRNNNQNNENQPEPAPRRPVVPHRNNAMETNSRGPSDHHNNNRPDDSSLYYYSWINNRVIRQLLGRNRFLDPTPINEVDLVRAQQIVDQFPVFVPLEQLQHPHVVALLQREIPEYPHAETLPLHAWLEKTAAVAAHLDGHAMGMISSSSSSWSSHAKPSSYSYNNPSAELLQLLYEENKYDLLLYQYLYDKLGLGPWTDNNNNNKWSPSRPRAQAAATTTTQRTE